MPERESAWFFRSVQETWARFSPVRVLAINQFYLPDHSASSQLLGELCEGLVGGGADVTVIASRGTYLGGERLCGHEVRGGVVVTRPWATSLGKRTKAHRMSDYLSFWASAVGAAVTAKRPDVLLALTTPPMIAAGAAVVGAARGIPLVTWVHDIYPEAAAAFGVLDPHGAPYRALRKAASATHALTRRIVTLGDDMADKLVAQGARPERIRVIPNWADGVRIRPIAHEGNAFRAEHDLQERFVVMYSGNLGEGHDVATFIEAARQLERSDRRVLFLFIGGGSREPEARRLAARLGNVRFLPYQPQSRLGESLPAADVHLISLRPGVEGLLVPSKLYGALASGRPVFYVGPSGSDVDRVIQRNGVGWSGRNGDASGLATELSRLAGDTEHWTSLSVRARAVFEARYDRPVTVAQWQAVLEEACG